MCVRIILREGERERGEREREGGGGARKKRLGGGGGENTIAKKN